MVDMLSLGISMHLSPNWCMHPANTTGWPLWSLAGNEIRLHFEWSMQGHMWPRTTHARFSAVMWFGLLTQGSASSAFMTIIPFFAPYNVFRTTAGVPSLCKKWSGTNSIWLAEMWNDFWSFFLRTILWIFNAALTTPLFEAGTVNPFFANHSLKFSHPFGLSWLFNSCITLPGDMLWRTFSTKSATSAIGIPWVNNTVANLFFVMNRNSSLLPPPCTGRTQCNLIKLSSSPLRFINNSSGSWRLPLQTHRIGQSTPKATVTRFHGDVMNSME